nr:hypothetical protein [Tanacetum cinerariifolium]
MEGTIGDNDEEKLQQLFEDSEKPLYVGCTKFYKLSAVIRLFKVKAQYGLSDTSFTAMLETFHEMLPKDNGLHVSLYQAKKMMCPIGLVIERINACPNDCILYRNEYQDLHSCVICNESSGDIRNIGFGLSSDGINPFGTMSSQHSIWPGPKQPGNDIDVYLAHLIDDMKTLWVDGVDVYDAYKKETFKLRAMIFCTISDFLAYGNLSGYSTKGKFACPVCEDQTSLRWLTNCKKTVFMGHRRSLESNHPYQKMKKEFDGRVEYGK